jgi:DNA-binding XRE family transcriptional regulator
MKKNISAKSVFQDLAGNPEFKKEFDALEEEFALARSMTQARVAAKLTQQELAQRMGTTQSAISRLEAGATTPSMTTLRRLAKATGTRVRITFVGAA